MLHRIKNFILDLLLPRRCIGCRKLGTWWCEACFSLIQEKPLISHSEAPLNGLMIAAHYESPLVKKSIHVFKYQGHHEDIAQKLGKLLTKALEKQFSGACLLIPVPLHEARQQERGFNQAELLCHAIAKWKNDCAVDCSLLKTKATRPQVGLSREERHANIRGAFSLSSPIKPDARYILVDDVVTTGATLQECCRVLKQHGAREVFGLVVARN